MVNLENKLTVDDLIVEYMMYKVKNGYEPSFLTSEFMSFLYFFESKMDVYDLLNENDKLFKRFFERKNESDWFNKPHMDMIFSEKDNDYLIRPNYKFSIYDESVINTYFMDNGMGKYEDFKGQTYKIRGIIGEYLSNQPKRQVDESIELDNAELIVGQYVSAGIVSNIWENYVNEKIRNNEWPRQCTDINKYLFKIDLAKTIGLKSIKNELMDLYNNFSKRIAILYHQDKNLRISTHSNVYLARANYDLLIRGYENIMDKTFNCYEKSFEVDLSNLTFKQSRPVNGIYDWDDDIDIKTEVNKVENDNIKKLVKSMNNIK